MNEWEIFFDSLAKTYDQEVFTKNTEAEIQFLLEELNLSQGSSILDVGCGIGRHTIPLAQSGFNMTGLDISNGMLSEARKRAAAAEVSINFIKADAKEFNFHSQFDAAICLCEGAICLLGSSDDAFSRDVQVLENIYNGLKPGGKLILNVLNALRFIRKMDAESIRSGRYNVDDQTEMTRLKSGQGEDASQIEIRERYYTPAELKRILEQIGFSVLQIWGGSAGAWNRQPVGLDEMEIMAVCRK